MIYIGLMSGTSMDGIDAALVRFGDPGVELLATHSHPYPDTLRHALGKAVMTPPDEPIADLGALDRQVGERFRDAANELLRKSGVDAAEVRAIGSHGQTVRHQPEGPHRYTLQIGNPGIIARGTGIITVGDFRSADMAAGGQGAPLVPPFHDWLFGGVTTTRVILNIGGIANVTILGAGDVRGFDTGPGNTLLDAWIQRHRKLPLDRDEKVELIRSLLAAQGVAEPVIKAEVRAYHIHHSVALDDANRDCARCHEASTEGEFGLADHLPGGVLPSLFRGIPESIREQWRQTADGRLELVRPAPLSTVKVTVQEKP